MIFLIGNMLFFLSCYFLNRISLFLLLKCLIIFLGVSLLKFILFEICLASSVRSFIFLKILKFSVVLSYHVFPSFNIFSLSLGSDDRVLALLLWSLGTWVLLTVLSGPLMYPASLHQHHQLSCFFVFFPPILFWAHHWRLLNVIIIIIFLVVVTLVFCFKLSSWYSFTLSVDEEPPVQFAFEDIFFPCDGSFSPHRIILLSVSSRYLCMAFCPSPYFFPASWRVTGSERWLNPDCLRCEILGLTYSTLAGSLGSAMEGDTLLLPLDLNSWSQLLLLTLGWILEFSLPLGWVLECRLPMCWMVESRLPLC